MVRLDPFKSFEAHDDSTIQHGKEGAVKKGLWLERKIRINPTTIINRGSFIDFINSYLPKEAHLKKGGLFGRGHLGWLIPGADDTKIMNTFTEVIKDPALFKCLATWDTKENAPPVIINGGIVVSRDFQKEKALFQSIAKKFSGALFTREYKYSTQTRAAYTQFLKTLKDEIQNHQGNIHQDTFKVVFFDMIDRSGLVGPAKASTKNFYYQAFPQTDIRSRNSILKYFQQHSRNSLNEQDLQLLDHVIINVLTSTDPALTRERVLDEVNKLDPQLYKKCIQSPQLYIDPVDSVDASSSPTDFPRAMSFSLSNETAVQALYQSLPPAVNSLCCQVQYQRGIGGCGSVVHAIFQEDENAQVAAMIAANSGMPLGALELPEKKGDDYYEQTPKHYLNCSTQEESVVENVLLTLFGENRGAQRTFFENVFKGVWGLKDVNSRDTYQGEDFVTTEDAKSYNRCYIAKNLQISALERDQQGFLDLVPHTAHPVTLIFADSVNAAARGTNSAQDYGFFIECIKEKLRSSMDAAAATGATHLLVAQISTNLYAPHQFKHAIRREFQGIVQDILDEVVGPQGEQRGQYFKQVIIPTI
jgi:hypothetical protein